VQGDVVSLEDGGEALGTAGYVEALERTRVGSYTADEAIRL